MMGIHNIIGIGIVIGVVALAIVWAFFLHKKPITEGEITDKIYEPAREWVQFMPVFISNGKTTTTMMIPMHMYDDEDFIIEIARYDQEKKKWLKNRIYVAQEVYNAVSVGDYYVFCPKKGDCLEDLHQKRQATDREQREMGVQ